MDCWVSWSKKDRLCPHMQQAAELLNLNQSIILAFWKSYLNSSREKGLVVLQVRVGRLRLLNNACKRLRPQGWETRVCTRYVIYLWRKLHLLSPAALSYSAVGQTDRQWEGGRETDGESFTFNWKTLQPAEVHSYNLKQAWLGLVMCLLYAQLTSAQVCLSMISQAIKLLHKQLWLLAVWMHCHLAVHPVKLRVKWSVFILTQTYGWLSVMALINQN